MSTFNNSAVTLRGAVIIASLVAGGTLTFTRIVVGDGNLPSGKNPMSMTGLANRLFDVPIQAVDWDSESKATVKGSFSNKDLATGFWYREIGLYCINPDTGEEELYCYGNAGDEAEYISPAGESSLIEKEVHLVTLIGNATEVTALFDDKTLALKSEVDAALALKADLDATDAEGGRVLARQMRFELNQILYVDASTAAGGDGSEAQPFRTITEAVAARYRGTNNIVIYIKPGTYTETIKVEAASGSSWFFGRWGDSGTVTVRGTLEMRNCNFFELSNINLISLDTEYVLAISRVAGFQLGGCTFEGGTTYAVLIGVSVGLIQNCIVNYSPNAVYAWGGSNISTVNITGHDCTNGLVADNSIIMDSGSTVGDQHKYVRASGGAINTADGAMSFTSNYSQLFYLGDFTTADALRAKILEVLNSLTVGESRACWFDNHIESFGPFEGEQRMQVDVIKSTDYGNGYGTAFFKSHHNVPLAFMQITDGFFAQPVPIALVTTEDAATPSTFGLMRVAAVEDETDCTCTDAALTPANFADMGDYRQASTSYAVGAVVRCLYHAELYLECTTAGKTSAAALDTKSVTAGQVLTDGKAQWTVKKRLVSVDGTKPDAMGNVPLDNVVHLSGNETITGLKMNTQNIYAKKAAPQLVLQNTDIVKGTNPDATKNTSLIFGSRTGTNSANSMAQIYNMLSADGTNELLLRIYRNVEEATTSGILRLTVTADGSREVTWDGKHLVRAINGTSADAAGNIALSNSVAVGTGVGGTAFKVPSGGTWRVMGLSTGRGIWYYADTVAGGTSITPSDSWEIAYIAIRVS